MTWNPEESHLLCRDLQHSWEPYTARTEGRGRTRGYVRVLTCIRCGSFKTQHLDRDGYITHTSMTYPKGYLRPGEGRLSRTDRAELRVRNLT